MPGLAPRLVLVLARIISVLCIAALGLLAAFDAKTERLTAGRVPAEFSQRLAVVPAGDYKRVTVVAHNAGDNLGVASKAVANGVDAIEIDVRSSGDELYASHDAPVPFLEDLVFRGPSMRDAWKVAQLAPAVLLHLKERSPRYLGQLRDLLASRPRGSTFVQTDDPETLRAVAHDMPAAQRLLLVLDSRDLERLRGDPKLLDTIDGVSVRDRLLTAPVQAWLEQRGLLTFAWTVNDEQRMGELIAQGIDGLITERLDMMRLLGRSPGLAS
jgi:glycerophosphoryl diester phosphodiesterase